MLHLKQILMTHKPAEGLLEEAVQHSCFRANLSYFRPEAAATFKENIILKKYNETNQNSDGKEKTAA